MNKWSIPQWVENEVINRDKKCVYCGVEFSLSDDNYKQKASWEHIINDLKNVSINNIVLCCVSCNSSKGSKPLKVWLNSDYCKSKNISIETVSPIVRQAINLE